MIEEAIQEIRELENRKERELDDARREAAKVIAQVEEQIGEMKERIMQQAEEKAQALRKEMLEEGEKEAKKIEEEFHRQAKKLEDTVSSRMRNIVSQLLEEVWEEYGD